MKSIVLSSGGVDSTTCLGIAVNRFGNENVISLACYYGQRLNKELECSTKIAEFYNVRHIELDLQDIFKYSDCPLMLGSTQKVPLETYGDQIKKNGEGKVSTYVPFRNGLMLSCASTLAQSIYPDEDVYIYLGAHADDALGHAYDDCSKEFIDTMNKAIMIGTYNKVHVEAPLVNWNKARVIREGLKLSVPYELTWSCYTGGDKPCGKCASCLHRIKSFELNGVHDPVQYMN